MRIIPPLPARQGRQATHARDKARDNTRVYAPNGLPAPQAGLTFLHQPDLNYGAPEVRTLISFGSMARSIAPLSLDY
jgi:hypothetical protein